MRRGLTACIEYLAAEIFDLCEGKESQGVAIANPQDVVFAVTTDEELHPTFKVPINQSHTNSLGGSRSL